MEDGLQSSALQLMIYWKIIIISFIIIADVMEKWMVGRAYVNGRWFTVQCSSVDNLLEDHHNIFYHHGRYDERMDGGPGILFSGRWFTDQCSSVDDLLEDHHNIFLSS